MEKVMVKVCMGTHCSMMGNLEIYSALEVLKKQYPEKLDLEIVKCLGACKGGNIPVISIDEEIHLSSRSDEIVSKILEVIN